MTIDHILTFNQHYKQIQNYFNVTNTRRNEFDFERQSNSIEKARSKLSGLNKTQFLELSTDVHDELERRISENSGDDMSSLGPIDSFHKKRNLAREKLSSLSERRFNDLLNDIAQEIERRGYDTIDLNEMEKTEDEQSPEKVITVTSTPLKDNSSKNTDTIKNIEDSIQQTVINPVKASIDWSSEEEEEEDNNDADEEEQGHKESEGEKHIANEEGHIAEMDQPQTTPEVDDSTVSPQDMLERKLDQDLMELSLTKVESKESLSSNKVMISAVPEAFNPIDNHPEGKQQLEQEQEDDFDFNKPLATITIQQQSSDINNSNKTIPLENFGIQETPTATTELDILREENIKLKNEIQLLKNHKGGYTTDKLPPLQFNEYLDSTGHIPLSLIEEFQLLCTRLYTIVNRNTGINGPSLSPEELGKKLFTKVFQISKNLQEVMLLSIVPEVANEILLLKSSLSHLITSIRYYSSFKQLVPPITVNTAIADLTFAFCNLISIVKIKSVNLANASKEIEDTVVNHNDVTLVNEMDASMVLSPNLSSKVKPLRLAEKLQNYESSLSLNDESENTVTTPTSTTSQIRSNPSKGLLFDRIDVNTLSPTSEKPKEKKEKIERLKDKHSMTIDDEHSTMTYSQPERNHSFMNRLKTDRFVEKLRHIGGK